MSPDCVSLAGHLHVTVPSGGNSRRSEEARGAAMATGASWQQFLRTRSHDPSPLSLLLLAGRESSEVSLASQDLELLN